MKIISVNTNGIRAAARKGFFDWMAAQNADVVCIQETKAQEHQLEDEQFRPDGYHVFYEDAEKKAKIYYELGNAYVNLVEYDKACAAFKNCLMEPYTASVKHQMDNVLKCQ